MGRKKAVQDWVRGGGMDPIEHKWAERERGIDVRFGSRPMAVLSVFLVVVACIAAFATFREPSPSSEPSTWSVTLGVAGKVFVGALCLLAVVAVLALTWKIGVWAYKALALARAEIDQARMYPKGDNGLSPIYMSDRGPVDLDAAPARRVTRKGDMPVPESDEHRQTADKARMMSLAVGAAAQIEWEREDEPPFKVLDGPRDVEIVEGLLTDGG